MFSRLWIKFFYFGCTRSRPRNVNDSQETSVPAWNLLLSHKQDFWDQRLAQIPITSNQNRTHKIRVEDRFNAGAQDINASGYELSDLDDIEFFSEKPQLALDAVFIDQRFVPFFASSLRQVEKGTIS